MVVTVVVDLGNAFVAGPTTGPAGEKVGPGIWYLVLCSKV